MKRLLPQTCASANRRIYTDKHNRNLRKSIDSPIRKFAAILLLLLMTNLAVNAQDIARRLYNSHETYKEKTLVHRRFKHKDVAPLINALNGVPPFEVGQVGESFEKRAIYQIKAGNGPAKILLWSQMHGDEATATMALFDIFNFLKAQGDGFDEFRKSILQKTTLYFVPMLNPDGAERFQRRTAVEIDMNRDALRTQTPEGTLLKKLQQDLQPLVGFNLHDQSPRYSVGKTGKQAVVSFLATAYDEDRNVNDVRKRSMQLIVGMNRVLQQFIPGQVARYDDEFEPRAFGDNIQKWGTTLVLIESGGYHGDPEKMAIRRLNFVAILTALAAIADHSYERESITGYQAIPENGRSLFDLLIRNATIVRDGKPVIMDIGINREEVNTNAGQGFCYKSTIEDLGDLSTFYGLEELDATGLTVEPALVYGDTLNSIADLSTIGVDALYEKGVVVFQVKQALSDNMPTQLVHLFEKDRPISLLEVGQIPTFLLKRREQLMYVLVNGFWRKNANISKIIPNGIGE